MTSCSRPQSRRSIARASSGPAGLPKATPSRTTSVSAARTTAPSARTATACAFLNASPATASGVGSPQSVSSISLGTTSNSGQIWRRSSRLRGDADASTTLTRGVAPIALQAAEGEGGDHDPDHPDQVHLEAQAEGDGEEAQVERHGRRQSDRRTADDEVVNAAGGKEATEQLAQQGPDDEAGDHHQEDQPNASPGCHRTARSGEDQRVRVGGDPR